jgi:dihydroxyacetone kinase
MGYVGQGLADGVAVGEVFASPSAETMLAVTRAIDGGAGVLHLYGNYTGDQMNFSLAAELAGDEGIEVATVVAADDVSSAPKGSESERRGIAGIAFLYKVAGARADEGASLTAVAEVAEKASAGLRSTGVALSPCVVPAAGRPTFEIDQGMMEVGMGIHGEPGVRRGPLAPAASIADEIVGSLLGDLVLDDGSEVAVLVNGLGATPKEELYILYRSVHTALEHRGIGIRTAWVGEFATSLEMAGASISIMRLDDELERLLGAPAHSPLLRPW